MLCDRCKKRPAVVFISSMKGTEKKNEGLCLVCAKEMGLPQVNEYMNQLGITDEDLEMFSDQLLAANDGDSFELGGSDTMPSFLSNLFGGSMSSSENQLTESNNNSTKNKKAKNTDNKKDDKKLKFLTTYCTNLNQKAVDGKIDNIIGRDSEIARVIQILTRRQKNNPCLIGEPGVGKTAIAEGIAQKIVNKQVPFHIANKVVYLLDLTALVAGTQFRGQFESRVKGLVDEVKSEGNVILFIDEVHNLVGTGDSEGTMNAANILKPALSRGEVQVIGATTFNEYRKYIEKDSALERRFQPVTVNEPNVEDSIEILRGIKKYYEEHHRVKVSDMNLRMCAVLSERYINDRFLPDKAIDLLDEACACAAIRSPELEELDGLYVKLKEQFTKENEIEASAEPDYEELATLKADILKTKDRLIEVEEKVNDIYITEEDLSKVIELWTGIPSAKIIEAEFSKIKNLKEVLYKKIIGQDEGVELVNNAIRRTRVQLSKRRRPASFIFVGPTGVGKTELVKVLADELFNTAEPLIRLDMSEFMEKHTVARMIGSPPGYVGYDDAGQLTEKVRRKPYSVVLFDEIEKAHPDVMNILLQILDEGKINDSHGKSVSFENTVIVMTSNAGSTDKSTGVGFNKSLKDISKEKAMKALSDFLRPEFLSRIDEIVVFNPLSKEDYSKITGLMLEEMREPLLEKDIKLKFDEKACDFIANQSFDGKFGARDIRKVLRKEVEDKIANMIVENGVEDISIISISADEKELLIQSL